MPRMIHHRSGGPSATRLAAFLGIDTSESIPSDEPRYDYLIRYGSRRSVPYRPEIRTLNRRRMLNRFSDRLDMLRRLRAAGVPTPEFGTSHLSIATPNGVLGRSNGGSRGRGIEHYGFDDEIGDHDFYMAYIPKARQFRVHVIGAETRTRELIPDHPDHRDGIIWNYGSGFTFRVPGEIPIPIVPAAVASVKALWLDFGAVDIITDNGGHPYVLEVNTAPGLSDATLEWYAEQIASTTGIEDYPGWDEVEREDSE